MGPLEPNLVELVFGSLCFLLVFTLIAKVVLPRIAKTLAEREAATDGTLALAEAAQLEAQHVRARYEAELAAARREAAQLRQAAHEEGVALVAAVRAEGQRARDELVAASSVQLEADRVIAEAELREDVLGLATELAGRILGEPLTDVERNRAIADAFFAEVDAEAAITKR
ncbi:F0F1 ATP synthase subunit B family protein [Streptomyces sp. NPDC004050]